MWWLLWAPEGRGLRARGKELTRRLHQLPECTAEGLNDEGEDEQCQLPSTHQGAHSFAMKPTGGRTPSAHGRSRLAAAMRDMLDDEEERAYYDEIDSLLAAPAAPLPLITEKEAIALAMMMRTISDTNWIVDDMAHQLVRRMDERLEKLA